MPGQRFFYSCVASSLFARRIVIFVLSQRDIAIAYDEYHAYFIVVEILGALKKGPPVIIPSNIAVAAGPRSWSRLERVHPSPAFFIDIGGLNG